MTTGDGSPIVRLTVTLRMRTESNLYSPRWFELFHLGIDEARTIQEVNFVCRCAPLLDFRKVIDVCCGMGRHARMLASAGYSVTGIDRDPDAITKAREVGGRPSYVIADIRDYQPESGAFDAAIVMGQSFGYFDAVTNRDVLGRLTAGVRTYGRVLLDLWAPEFFAAHQGERELETAAGVVRENKRVHRDRLYVQLEYPDGTQEQFEWQLFTPAEMKQLAQSVGLNLLFSCTDFDSATLPSPANPRIQFLLERRS